MSDKITQPLKIGDRLWIWFDTGAMGMTPLVGTVKQTGSKYALVEWESGIRNRLRWERIYRIAKHYNGEWD